MAHGSRPWLLNARRKNAWAAATSRFGAEQEVDSFPIAGDRAIEVSYTSGIDL
jgi:hypothetical protein